MRGWVGGELGNERWVMGNGYVDGDKIPYVLKVIFVRNLRVGPATS